MSGEARRRSRLSSAERTWLSCVLIRGGAPVAASESTCRLDRPLSSSMRARKLLVPSMSALLDTGTVGGVPPSALFSGAVRGAMVAGSGGGGCRLGGLEGGVSVGGQVFDALWSIISLLSTRSQ